MFLGKSVCHYKNIFCSSKYGLQTYSSKEQILGKDFVTDHSQLSAHSVLSVVPLQLHLY